MNFAGTLHLGWRYVRRKKRTTALLVAAISLSLFLPLAIGIVVQDAEAHLRARSRSTPLLLGAAGSPLELVFNGIYFGEPGIAGLTMAEADAVRRGDLAGVVPLHVRFEARGYRIVGTSVDYFGFRGLRPATGNLFGRLGDCVLGAAVASELGLTVGDSIISAPEQVFDLAGVYPLKMKITGVLAPTGQADDRAVFVDLKTAWIIAGIGHGHIEPAGADEVVLRRDGDNVALSAAVVEYAEITDDNIASFHFHGDRGSFPITSAIAVPRDDRAATILLGRYVGDRSPAQLVRPDAVVDGLFQTVFQIRDLVIAALAAVGLTAAGIAMLVFFLSNKLRAREFESLGNIGADRGTVRALVLFEAMFVLATSAALAAAMLALLRLAVPTLLTALTS